MHSPFDGLAGNYSTINFTQAAGFAKPTYYHVRQGGACALIAPPGLPSRDLVRCPRTPMCPLWLQLLTILVDADSATRSYSPRSTDSIADVGAVVIRWVETLGDMALFMWRTVSWLVSRLPRRDTLIPAFYNIGVLSLPVVALTGTFIGMVLAVQSYAQFRQFGFETRLGALINLSMCRELGPVLAATMLAGRVGSAIAAEIGTMRVTEQIDALTSMGANPVHYLVVPRFLGCLLMIPSLTIMAIFMGVVGGWLYSVNVFGIDSYHYWHNSQQFVHNWDLFYGIFKSVFFGATIAIVSCYRGFNCAPGAEGVGRAATAAFVLSFVIILMLDFFLSIGLDRVHDIHLAGFDDPVTTCNRSGLTMAWLNRLLQQHLEESHRTAGLIELHELSVSFGRQLVLRDISLSIPRGQTLAIIGESGCGKTVLLKTIIGLLRPTSGHVVFDGQRIDELSDKELTALADAIWVSVPGRCFVRQHDHCRQRRLSAARKPPAASRGD